jgi:hypothetical protein
VPRSTAISLAGISELKRKEGSFILWAISRIQLGGASEPKLTNAVNPDKTES